MKPSIWIGLVLLGGMSGWTADAGPRESTSLPAGAASAPNPGPMPSQDPIPGPMPSEKTFPGTTATSTDQVRGNAIRETRIAEVEMKLKDATLTSRERRRLKKELHTLKANRENPDVIQSRGPKG